MLLLPASRASSTYASCQNQGIGSVVFAHDQEAVGVESGGGAGDHAVGWSTVTRRAGGVDWKRG